jgi:hypothetical protein
MGTLLDFRPTRKSILRAGRREMERMYRLSAGGQDPLPGSESRELFDLGLIDEVGWQDWETYCKDLLNGMFDGL